MNEFEIDQSNLFYHNAEQNQEIQNFVLALVRQQRKYIRRDCSYVVADKSTAFKGLVIH